MKNNKTSNYLVLAISLSLLLSTQYTYAVAKVPFPISSRSQPIPANTYPNISHNINSTLPVEPGIQKTTEEPSPTTTTQSEAKVSSSNWPTIVIIVLALFVAGFFVSKKLKK